MMDTFFYDRRELKEQQIKYALHDDEVGTVKGVGMSGASSVSMKMPGHSGKVRARRRRLRMMVGGAVVGTAAMVVTAVLLLQWFGPWRGRAKESEGKTAQAAPRKEDVKPRPEARKTPPRPRSKAKVTLKVIVEPEEAAATIVFRGKAHPGPVFSAQLLRSTKSETIEVKAPGYMGRSLVVVPNEDNEVKVRLTPAPARPRGRRRKPRRKKPPRLRELP
jgi:hypothetical protein